MLAAIRQELESQWIPEPYQEPPDGDWTYWLLLAGRGSGKTDAGASWVDEQARAKPTRGIIIAPTREDARLSCVEGPSGLLAHNSRIRYDRQHSELHWPNGSMANLFGAYTPEDVERLRAGGNRHWGWLEEMAAWRQLEPAFDHFRFGLRLGQHPRAVITTTPKPRGLLVGTARREGLLQRPDVVVTTATTYDNPHLAQHVRAGLLELYEGTRIGRQELNAEVLTDIPGALWQGTWIDDHRRAEHPELTRVVIAIDPAGSAGEDSDETAIVAAGKGTDGDYYVLHAEGYRLSPAGWAERAIDLFDDHEADLIVAEVNNGGDMVESTLRQVRPSSELPIRKVHAKRGKTLRAEPISRLYETGRVHHVGIFPHLEDELAVFGAPGQKELDDIVDANVYALTELSGLRQKWGLA